MAPGARRRRRLIEGLFVPAFESADARPSSATPARVEVDGTELAMTTDSYVVKPLRFPGGSIGELAVNGTVNDLAVSGAQAAGADSCRLCSRRGCPPTNCAPRSRRSRSRATRPGCEIVAGDTKVVERGRAEGMYVCTTGIGRRDPRAKPVACGAASRATGSCCRGASASTAPRSCSRAASSSSTPRSSPTPGRCGRPSTRCSTRPGRSFTACATRPAAASPRC